MEVEELNHLTNGHHHINQHPSNLELPITNGNSIPILTPPFPEQSTSNLKNESFQSTIPPTTSILPESIPSPPIIPTPTIPLMNPELELPVIMNDLIPLSFIVERLVGQAYAELVNLAEILPSTPDDARKRAIVDYVLQTRRQILKLLVLVRWSNEAENVGKCMNIVGFLSRQNYEFDHTIDSLTSVKTMLASARVRNYDLPTALSVLTTGTYTGLPSIINETFGKAEKLTDEEVQKTINELEEVLRWRLSCVEVIPEVLSGSGKSKLGRGWSIDKGRAIFRLEGMWEAEFTYGGDNDDVTANWYLLNLKFLFRVKDIRGVWSNTPVGPMKDHIIELCNSELARRSSPTSSTSIEGVEGEEQLKSIPFLDVPLVRGYNFIQRLALSYQLEALHSQAVLLAGTNWSGNLRVELSTDRKRLKVEYWAPPPIPASKSRAPATNPIPIPVPQGLIIISIEDQFESSKSSTTNSTGRSTIGNGKGKERERDGLMKAGKESEETREVKSKLKIEWITDGLKEDKKEDVDLSLDTDLDLEALLLRTTSTHARESTLQIYDQLLQDLDSTDLELLSSDPPSSTTSSTISLVPTSLKGIRIHLHGQHYIIASINLFSGKLELKAQGEVSFSREMRLRNAADKVGKERSGLIGETILRVRASTILDEADSRAAYLGLTTLRRLPLRPQDISKFGQATRQFLFIRLHSQLPLYYLVLVMTEDGFRFALISVKEGSDNLQSWVSIEELGWLEKRVAEDSEKGEGSWGERVSMGEEAWKKELHGFDLNIEDLRDLHSYCLQRIAFFKIEQQLHIRKIPYKLVASYLNNQAAMESASTTSTITTKKSHLLSNSSPYLVVHSFDLIRSNVKVAYSNIAIQCYLKDNVIKTTLYVRFKDLSLVDFPNPKDLPSCMTCDPKTWTVTFTSDDLDNCISTFLAAYSVVTRAVLLARHNRSIQRQQEKKDSKMLTGS